MGLLADLGCEVRAPNRFQRGIQVIGSTKPVAWVFHKTLHPIDRALHRVTNDTVAVPGTFAGVQVIIITTGARTGQPHSMPLVGIPIGDSLGILGTNYGQKPTPGWVYDLRADLSAVVAYRGRDAPSPHRRRRRKDPMRRSPSLPGCTSGTRSIANESPVAR